MLSFLAIVAAWPSNRFRLIRATISGLALGCAFLTKIEVFLPGIVATATALLMAMWFERPGWARCFARLSCFCVAFAIPPMVAFLGFASVMPAHDALLGILGHFRLAVSRDILKLPFFRRGLGTDAPMHNVGIMLSMTGLYLLVLVPAGMLGLGLRRPGRHRAVIAAAVFAADAWLLWCFGTGVPWYDIARPFPLLVILTALAVAGNFLSCRHDKAAQRQFVRKTSLLLFAMVLLGKMILNARIANYGFVLAMPAALLLTIAALDWAPAFIDRKGGYGGVFTAAATALICVAGLAYLNVQAFAIGRKSVEVGQGADAFWADPRGTFVNAVLTQIAGRSSPETTLAVFPEGTLINCLSRLRNPTPYIAVLPPEMIVFGESQMLDSLRAHPPDLIVVAQRDDFAFGFPFFGRDYAQHIGAWIRANYRPVWQMGPSPWEGQQFGIQLLENKNGVKNRGRSQEKITPGKSSVPMGTATLEPFSNRSP
jgi:hypothetical protein